MSKIVFITGISSGIGYHFADFLNQNQYRVFGSVRSAQDVERIEQELEGVRAVLMDVSDPRSIQNGVEQLAGILSGKNVDVLINNAGIVEPGPLFYLSYEKMKQQLDVNVLGMVAVTNAVYPLLTKSAARIINIGSISGIFASPFTGAYSASKYAVEGLTDSLRREAAILGIKVVLFQPGPIKTPIWGKGLNSVLQFSGTAYDQFLDRANEIIRLTEETALDPSAFDKVLLHAIESPSPKNRYLIHKHPFLFRIVAYVIPSKWVDYLIAKNLVSTKSKIRPLS